MRHLTDHLTEAADHLALDEALLMEAEAGHGGETLRVWEFDQHVVVAGRSTRVDEEIDRDFCQTHGIPILRRCSGGASVVGGPGCVMYSVVLSFTREPALSRIDVAHQYVMSRVLAALQQQIPEVELQGTCDLTWQNRKFSGNSLRITRQHLLYHGTILSSFDLDLIPLCLKHAPRQPEYRKGRDHGDFVTNMPIDRSKFSNAFGEALGVTEQREMESLQSRIRELRGQRYDAAEWNFRH